MDRVGTAARGAGRRHWPHAILLTELSGPVATTKLAERLGRAKAAVFAHLTALRAAGLVTAPRCGNRVLDDRTDLGDALQAGIG
ncbi:MAG TPA: helix-turn-helix domain-containing protein [Amycolatopsis sp.]|nr:helix-turn-helix domain-containing protein [Amycolatopsis sp.]